MKKILIHSQNSTLVDLNIFDVSEQITLFDGDDFEDVDQHIHNILSDSNYVQKLSEADLIFIKLGLSENYLEYYGLRVAYHIRLSQSLNIKTNVPIVFVGEESISVIGLTAELPEILFTGGIYLMNDTKDAYDHTMARYDKSLIKPLASMEKFIEKIKIDAPTNYLSRHSISNEYGILNWAETIDIKKEVKVQELLSKLEPMLYYKYLTVRDSPLRNVNTKIISTQINLSTKVLYIDDEWNKGWQNILQKIFNNNSKFETLELEYKEMSSEDIIQHFEIKFKDFNPDIVLLDLRLCDQDFSKDILTENLTGLKILNLIKKENLGIQVVFFSATNKIWNLLELQNKRVDSFLLKNPSSNNDYSKLIESFITTIEYTQKETFKKELLESFRDIKSILTKEEAKNSSGVKLYDDFISTLLKKNEIIVSTTSIIKLENKSSIDIAFLCVFNFLEEFKKYYFSNKNGKIGEEEMGFVCYELNGKSVFIQRNFNGDARNSWSTNVAFLFKNYFKMNDSSMMIKIFNINQNRNDFIHKNLEHLSVSDLMDITKLALYLCQKLKP